jgi:two-component system phosphate regulon sensor histidine kinase PhoR
LREGRAEGPEEVRECVAIISSEADRLSRMVDKLLDWSRLESGRGKLELERTHVPALLDRIGDTYKAQQLPANYRMEVVPGLPPVNVDRDAMAQVVLNLLHNAVKYTLPPRSARLERDEARGGPGDRTALIWNDPSNHSIFSS